ncbi:panthothenate synthetase [bacterium]|nr:panthothenate synthetase [bacterium]
MRFMLKVTIPNEEFNAAVKNGSAGKKIQSIMETVQPEAAYFTEEGGYRQAVMIVDIADASKVPSKMEPFYLVFNAEVEARVVMLPEDLQKSGLEEIGKKWG